MKFSLFASTASAFVLTLASVTAAGSAGPVAAMAAELPPGPGKDTLVRVCSDCHGVDLVEGQRRTRGQWKELVDDMVARGANSSDEDVKAIINYRTTVGEFKAIDDLKKVPGLDFSKVEAKKDRITFAGQ